MIRQWDGDGHNHSYLYLHELKDMVRFLSNKTVEVKGMKENDQLDKFLASVNSDSPNWDLLYPYCGGTNSPDYRSFKVNVPAMFKVGSGLEDIISAFDGIDGDNHRIVFFFDS